MGVGAVALSGGSRSQEELQMGSQASLSCPWPCAMLASPLMWTERFLLRQERKDGEALGTDVVRAFV